MKVRPIWLFVLLTTTAAQALLVGCSAKEPSVNSLSEISADVKKQLAFTCAKEFDRLPPRDPDADQLYKHARWLTKRNVLKQDPTAYVLIERLLRIATAYGHDRANIELRDMLDKGRALSADPVNETIDLVQDLIRREIPAGYYDMGWYLEHGYGVKPDQELAFRYYRRAADLGSPDAQYLVGKKFSDERKLGKDVAEIGNAMRQCAALQEHAEAANSYGTYLKVAGKDGESLAYMQIAVASGSSESAYALTSAFSKEFHRDEVLGLGQAIDPERQARYKKISDFLSDYSYLNPKVPEINDIVPLPPAKLPPWDGKFKWLEEHKANVPPPLPTEARIAEMAKAKGLDPATGRPTQRK